MKIYTLSCAQMTLEVKISSALFVVTPCNGTGN